MRLAVLEHIEIVLGQAADEPAVPIDHADIDFDELGVGPEGRRLLSM